jgi:hypothetical protein
MEPSLSSRLTRPWAHEPLPRGAGREQLLAQQCQQRLFEGIKLTRSQPAAVGRLRARRPGLTVRA